MHIKRSLPVVHLANECMSWRNTITSPEFPHFSIRNVHLNESPLNLLASIAHGQKKVGTGKMLGCGYAKRFDYHCYIQSIRSLFATIDFQGIMHRFADFEFNDVGALLEIINIRRIMLAMSN